MKNFDILDNASWLKEQYIDKKRSLINIAKEIGCSLYTVRRYLVKYSIKIRNKKVVSNLKNQKFGNLTVIGLDNINNNKSYWFCKCDCGNEKVISSNSLTTGRTKSCGCLRRNKISRSFWKGFGEISGQHFSNIKQHAKARGRTFNLKIEDLWTLFLKQDKKCALSGLELCFNSRLPLNTTASLDRKNNEKGYEIDNVQWVHKNINMMKRSLSDVEFISFCKQVSDFQRNKL